MDIKQVVEKLKELQDNCTHEEGYQALNTAIRELLKHRANEIKNKKAFKWIKCKRKNGTEFLKLIYYSYEADGWVETGRFNMTKSEFVCNQWSLNEIFEELQD